MDRQRITGVICLVGGLLLIVWGHNMAQSISGELQTAFTGSPGNKPLWLYFIGTALMIAGLGRLVWKRK
jgi:hypothetical protein